MMVRICAMAASIGSSPSHPVARSTGARSDGRFDALQLDPRAEQLLDDVVVQVTGDARAVFEEQHPLPVGPRRGQLDRDRRLDGRSAADALQVERL